jgi:anthranilate synthase/aminodeoxychorismate synthase-like glutamine amidotransferase
MILVLDNYDSFTFNLVQLLGRFRQDLVIKRNDEIRVEAVVAMHPERILISPGPGRPEHAGITLPLIRACGEQIPILGVCLGHQAIGLAFGASVVHAPALMHGRTSKIHHDQQKIYRNVADPFTATRYHSLVIDPVGVPADLQVVARTSDGVIMGVRHRSFPVEGVQFHPESILTESGEQIIRNWLQVQL